MILDFSWKFAATVAVAIVSSLFGPAVSSLHAQRAMGDIKVAVYPNNDGTYTIIGTYIRKGDTEPKPLPAGWNIRIVARLIKLGSPLFTVGRWFTVNPAKIDFPGSLKNVAAGDYYFWAQL